MFCLSSHLSFARQDNFASGHRCGIDKFKYKFDDTRSVQITGRLLPAIVRLWINAVSATMALRVYNTDRDIHYDIWE